VAGQFSVESNKRIIRHFLPDLSRSKNNAVPNGSAPTYNAPGATGSLAGKGTIHFDSGGSVTNATGLATRTSANIKGADPRSVFAVMRRQTAGTMMVNMGDARAKGSLFAIEITNNLYLPTGWLGADNRIRSTPTNWSILETIYDGKEMKGYVDGVLRESAEKPINTADKNVQIGFRSSDPAGKNAKAADGDFAELLIYNRPLGVDKRIAVENYLGTKWFGITQSVKDFPQRVTPLRRLFFHQHQIRSTKCPFFIADVARISFSCGSHPSSMPGCFYLVPTIFAKSP
jgi:hypothetical protein